MADRANFIRGSRFRSLVASVLGAYGVAATERPRKLSDRLAGDEPQLSDVLMNDIAVTTSHTARQRQWSALLDQAEQAAIADRRRYGVAVISRPDRDIRGQFVLTTFGTLLDLAATGLNAQKEK
jgi:hypothetical protein